MAISKQKRDKLIDQSLYEIQFARQYRQGIVWRWFRNEDLYYGNKEVRNSTVAPTDYGNRDLSPTAESRANVNVASAKTISFVESLLSKIDNPLIFKFNKRTLADLNRAKLLNALREQDANDDDWNMKDLLGKVQAIIYGRAVYAYHAENIDGYMPYLENVDVYDFLIDPSAGGYDIDNASYLGRYNIRKNKYELKKGKRDGIYIGSEVDKLINGSGNDANQTSQEDVNKQNKYAYIGSPANRTIQDPDIYKLWEWYTTYDGERYYLLMEETSGTCIRCEKLSDLFKVDKRIGDANYPFWSWAFTPNLTEFWTPSKVDYVRDIFMAQGVNINQMLDNAERINKPQRAVDVQAIENMADLVYRRNGVIRIKPGIDINRAFQVIQTPSIDTPLKVYEALDSIQQLESGVTASAKGVAEEDKVGIYEGNQANTADKYGMWNKSYSNGYKRFAKLWRYGVDYNLTTKKSVKILGTNGLESTVFISKRDVKPKEEYEIMVEASNAEFQADAIDKKNKITFLAGYKGDSTINQKQLFEQGATIAGFDSNDIRQLLDQSEYGEASMLSEADRDVEYLLDKKIIEPNANANTAYMKYILNYMREHKEDMDDDTFLIFQDYLNRVEQVVINNMGSNLMSEVAKQGLNPDMGTNVGAGKIAQVSPEVQGNTEGQLATNEPQPIA